MLLRAGGRRASAQARHGRALSTPGQSLRSFRTQLPFWPPPKARGFSSLIRGPGEGCCHSRWRTGVPALPVCPQSSGGPVWLTFCLACWEAPGPNPPIPPAPKKLEPSLPGSKLHVLRGTLSSQHTPAFCPGLEGGAWVCSWGGLPFGHSLARARPVPAGEALGAAQSLLPPEAPEAESPPQPPGAAPGRGADWRAGRGEGGCGGGEGGALGTLWPAEGWGGGSVLEAWPRLPPGLWC